MHFRMVKLGKNQVMHTQERSCNRLQAETGSHTFERAVQFLERNTIGLQTRVQLRFTAGYTSRLYGLFSRLMRS